MDFNLVEQIFFLGNELGRRACGEHHDDARRNTRVEYSGVSVTHVLSIVDAKLGKNPEL